jgi:hypothetical protein
MLTREELHWTHFPSLGLSKLTFGSGEWQYEPDRVWYIDEDSGLYCLIMRQPYLGSLSGYIAVPKEHPWHQQNDIPIAGLVHGGITYTNSNKLYLQHFLSNGSKFVGPLIESYSDTGLLLWDPTLWLIGFDCCHYSDMMPAIDGALPPVTRRYKIYRAIDFVESQLKQLCRHAILALG